VSRVPIRAAELSAGATIQVPSRRRPDWTLLHADPSLGLLVRNPNGSSWIVDRVSSDSGGLDLFEVRDDGTERRLTATPGDDDGGVWSPDGRFLAYYTARWSRDDSHYDLAIRDMSSGVTRRLTSSDDSDASILWSPDGSRIAFERFYWGKGRREACVTSVEGTGLRCFGDPLVDYSPIGGWYDSEHLVVALGKGPRQTLGRIDVSAGTLDTIAVINSNIMWVSPDARWVLCRCRKVGFAADAILLFPVDEPNRVVEVNARAIAGDGHLLVSWVGSRLPTRWVDRLTIDHGIGAPMVGVPHHLGVMGRSVEGAEVPIGPVTWRSLDTTAATIDATGLLSPRVAGAVRIEAMLPGWRTTQATLFVRPAVTAELLREDWSSGIGPSWVPFGDPRPRIDSMPDGTRAFLNGGDGNFVSGAYTARTFPLADGLVLTTWISAVITKIQWQIASVGLDGGLDDAGLRRWGHRFGNYPRRDAEWPFCKMYYPGGMEGTTYGDSISATAGRPSVVVSAPAPRAFRSGERIRVQIQIFPDGRCGVALNGVPIVLSAARIIPDSAVRVIIFGNTRDSKVVVGPLEVRSGVARDIDWSRLGDPVPNAPRDVPPRPTGRPAEDSRRP
jgi:hypothetical protein